MVIGRGNGEDLADTLLGKHLLGHAQKLSWVIKCSNSNNATLALGQTWNRVNGSNTTWVSERNCGAGKVLCGELVVAGSLYQVFVSKHELIKVQSLSTLDVWN